MSELEHNNNAGPRPARSRFNFSNTRFTPATSEVNHEHTVRREKPRHNPRQDKDGPLIFNVAQLLRDHEGATREYDYEQDRLHLNDELDEDIPESDATNISGHVRFMHVRHDVLAQGPGEADVVLNCVRCLNDFEQHIEYELEEVFRPSIDVITGLAVTPEEPEDEADLKIDANHLIDLGEAIRQQILVSLPMQPLCGPDCPGLYQYLDEINRDSDQTEDEPEADEEETIPADPRWGALSKLKLPE
jgi:uncharacterized protein